MITLLLSLLVIDITSSYCPYSKLIKPCSCEDDKFDCSDIYEDTDLVEIFQTLGKQLQDYEKHFKLFLMKDGVVNQLKENTFSDITFDKIQIINCDRLKTIDRNAFNNTNRVATEVHIYGNSLLTSPDNSIFEVLNEFDQAEKISFYNNERITEIPANAFKNKQDELKVLDLRGESFYILKNNAFSRLRNLIYLDLSKTSIDFIPENAFEFNETSKQELTIDLRFNEYLNNSGFAMNSITKLKRPTKIKLVNGSSTTQFENFPYLNKTIFLPFLTSNYLNTIELSTRSIDCGDCRNLWIQRNSSLTKQIIPWTCSNDNFNHCTNGAIIWGGHAKIVATMVILLFGKQLFYNYN